MIEPIYLDYAATTPVDPRVAEKMQACLTRTGCFANPASQHVYGKAAKTAVDQAREQIAAYLQATAAEIIFTSGATESNNLAIKGAAHLYSRKGKHIVTMKTEHKSVLDVCQHLEKEGYTVTYLAPQASGLLDLEQFKAALREDTILVSIMQVNNETGVVQNLSAIANETASRGILLHVDAAQSVGKIAIDLSSLPIDLLSVCAHKVYGPKGVGALYLRRKPRVRVEPLIHGGGHEHGMRSGTLPTHQIAGMGEAFYLAMKEKQKDTQQVTELHHLFLQKIKNIRNLKLNSELINGVPHILNLRFDGMLADAILAKLPMIAASTASACQGKGTEGSYVLKAMGLTEAEIKSSIRFSLGRFTTSAEIELAANEIVELFHSSP